jgi:4-diphosphocytidyl-2-C-methyl-D-erythritol kinase
VKVTAHAKINLTLEVLGKRSDGYHTISTVLQTVSLADDIQLEPAGGIMLASPLPGVRQEEDLTYKAAVLLRQASPQQAGERGVRIAVTKRIPVAGGLGGGSSDGAAVLRGLNDLWGLGWTRERLAELAGRLGADVPFFIYGGTAVAQGRGERITPLPPMPLQWLVLLPVLETVPNKTRTLFARVTPAHYTDGARTAELVSLLREGKGVPSEKMFNVFEHVAKEIFPSLASHWRRFEQAGASPIHMAGAGPTLFTFVGNREEGERLQQRLRSQGMDSFVVCTVWP